MKILVIGADGFIGRNICTSLGEIHDIYKVCRRSLPDGDEKVFAADLADFAEVTRMLGSLSFSRLRIDLVIHCAARLASGESSRNMDIFLENNRITESVVRIAGKLDVARVINFSTIGVYPNSDGIYSETSAVNTTLNAECLYSLSKFCSEQVFEFFIGEGKVVNLRLAQTFGPGMRDDRIYALFLKELQENNTITVWGNGERVSNFISISKLVEIIQHIVGDIRIAGVYNTGEKNISYGQLAEMLIDEFGNSESRIIKIEKGTRAKVVIDCSKLNNSIKNGE